MRILLTGISSFTGYWFAKELVHAGHHVFATFRGERKSYQGIRRTRVERILNQVEPLWNLDGGSTEFLELVRSSKFDLYCHHAATMDNYRSWDFDAIEATKKNTQSARDILSALVKNGCQKVIITGSVFEPFEGVGDIDHRAFNPYGLSKHFSFEIYRMESHRLGMRIGKFVIPNPFGPLEEPRFTTYLAREWAANRVPMVKTPEYIRDNIHVGLLAMAYREFCESLSSQNGVSRVDPSGYVESQGAFANRVAREFGIRTGRDLEVQCTPQIERSEPLIRVNTAPSAQSYNKWSEAQAWDEACDYWMETSRSPD